MGTAQTCDCESATFGNMSGGGVIRGLLVVGLVVVW